MKTLSSTIEINGEFLREPYSVISVFNIKTFIRLLKKEFRKGIIINDFNRAFMVSIKEIEMTIDKLAGEELAWIKNGEKSMAFGLMMRVL